MTAPWHLAKRILIIFILAWGALAVLVRLVTPLLEHAREPITNWLSTQTGQHITIGRLSATWQGLGPRLRLQQVRVGEAEPPLELQEATIGIALSGLFGDTPLDALRLTLRGLDLHLQREANGQVHLLGLPLDTGTAESADVPVTLPGRLRLHDIRLHFQDLRVKKAQPLTIDDLSLDLRRDGEQLQLRARLDSAVGKVWFAADLLGSLRNTNWSGSSYLQVQGANLASLLGAYLPAHYRIENGQLDLQLWQQWQDALPLDSRGNIALHNASLSGTGEPARQVSFNRISSEFQFERFDAQQWQLQLEQLQVMAKNGSPWPTGKVAVRRFLSGELPTLDAALEHLGIDDLARLVLIRAPSVETQEAISQLQPGGWIHQVRLHLPQNPEDWRASARFDKIATRAWRKIPGVRNLSGRIAATAQHASVSLATREAPVDYSGLFRYPLHASRLDGDLHLTRQEQGWTLLSDGLRLDTPDLRTSTRLELSLRAEKSPHLKLISQAYDGNAAATPKYLPAAIMSEKLVNWLDSAISEGRVETASVLLNGPLDTFPYHKQRNGVFEVEAVVRDAPLHYRQGWPELRDLSVHLMFHENSMDIELLEGQVYDSPVKQLHASIANLKPVSPLQISGRIEGPLKDQVAVLREDALRNKFGHIAAALAVDGNAELNLDFDVPLSSLGKYRLDGTLLFRNAQMSLPEWDLLVENINGKLAISLDSLSARGISGRTLGTPVKVSVVPRAEHSTRVSAQLHLQRDAIAKRLPQIPLQLASGSADFSIDLDIPGISAGPGAPTWLSVSSDLKGMRLDLPQPFGKTASQQRKLLVKMPVAGKPDATAISYNGKLSAAISPDWKNADIRYQRGTASMPKSGGYQFKGSFDELDLEAWQALIPHLGKQQGDKASGWSADIDTRQLRFGTLVLEQASLVLASNEKGINGGLLSDKLAGRFDYPAGEDQPLRVQLQKAHLAFDTSAESDPLPPEPAREPDPRSLPAVQLECADLRLNNARLGEAKLVTERTPLGMRITQLKLDGPDAKLQASGSWNWRDKQQHTELTGKLETGKLGGLLHRLGYPRHVQKAGAKASFNLGWPGHPGQAHKASISGTLETRIDAGRLAKVDPGITRVIGLLSVDALTRRLKLDFGDLTKEGYSFDSITGGFRLQDGHAETNDLLIDGPSGRIEVGGRIGLVDQDFDQLVSVTPKLDATLPIASTIAGGPVAGVATLLAQQLMADEVDRINRFEYSVRGSWDEPELIPLDSGAGLSRLINTLTGQKTESKTAEQEELIKRPVEEKPNPLKRLLKVLPDTLKKLPGGASEDAPAE